MINSCAAIVIAAKHGELIKVKDASGVAHTVGTLRCKFEFRTTDWNYTKRTAVFCKGNVSTHPDVVNTAIGVLLDGVDECAVPPEVLLPDEKYFSVGVWGVSEGGLRIVSEWLVYKIKEGCFVSSAESLLPTPSVYEQIMIALNSKSPLDHKHEEYISSEDLDIKINDVINNSKLDQYTTEQEVRDIVDDANAQMTQDIDTLKGKVVAIEEKPAYNILSTDIESWNKENGAKALAETKTTTEEVKKQIESYEYATDEDLDTLKQSVGTLPDWFVDAYADNLGDAVGVLLGRGDEIYATKKEVEEIRNNDASPVQANWNQNDCAAKDYVKNRPFYSSNLVELCNGTYTSVSNHEDYGGAYGISVYYNVQEVPAFNQDQSINIKVLFDGVEYNLSTTYFDPMRSAVAGNLAMLNQLFGTDFEETEEPFVISLSLENALIWADFTQSTTHDIAIFMIMEKEECFVIQDKYIPDSIARIGHIPTNYVTTDTNQTILADKTFEAVHSNAYITVGNGSSPGPNGGSFLTSGMLMLSNGDSDYTMYQKDGIQKSGNVLYLPDESGTIATREWLHSGDCNDLHSHNIVTNRIVIPNQASHEVELCSDENLDDDISVALPMKSGQLALTSDVAALHEEIKNEFVAKDDIPSINFATVEDITSIFNKEA